MRILYVILTCDKFAERRKLQEESWLKYIGQSDEVIYLDDKNVREDTYDNVPRKYSDFIREFHRFNEFDWVFFADDDTFVFPRKLQHLLSYQDCSKPLMIGRTGVYDGYTYCSGGAGFAVSRVLMLQTKSYLHNQAFKHFPNSDTSFARWAKEAVPNMGTLDRKEQFQTQHLRHDDNALVDIDSCITFHYIDQYDYNILNKHLKFSL